MKWNLLLGTLVLGFGLCTQQSFGFELLDRMLGVGGSGCGCSSKSSSGCDSVKGACQKNGCGASQKSGCGSAQKGCDSKGASQKGGCDGKGKGGCGASQKGGCGGKGGCGAAQKGCGCKSSLFGSLGGCGATQKGCGGGGLLDSLFGCNSCCSSKGKGGCDSGKGGCGASQKGGGGSKNGCGATQKGCGGGGLLDSLFGCNSCCSSKGKGGCDSGKGGCGASQKGDGYKGVAPTPSSGGCVDKLSAPMPPAPIVDPSASRRTSSSIRRVSLLH
jgi:hypothetical protein